MSNQNLKAPAASKAAPGREFDRFRQDAADSRRDGLQMALFSADAIRARVLLALTESPIPITAEEVCRKIGMDPTSQGHLGTVRSRISELRDRGAIVAVGRRMNERTGVRITLWKAL